MADPAPRTGRLLLLANSHRVAPGLLSWPAWQALREGQVYTADPAHPQLPALAAAGVTVTVLDPADGPLAARFREQAREGRTAVWLAGPGGDEEFARALGDLVATEAAAGAPPELEVVPASYDLPGARLLDVVAVMDRLRSPGGCPWDAEQTHESLAKYLLEEAYEAYEAIENTDLAHLREELGDVLIQVAFHARLAEERTDGTGFTIDDVAGDLVDKLVRRHPHVFGDAIVHDADHVEANWEVIKQAEKGRTSVTEGVPMGQPALSLAQKLQSRAAKAGYPPAQVAPGLADAVTALDSAPSEQALGDLLLAAVARARELGVDPEAALRTRARAFRDALASWEREGQA